jgi:hypothetical protein
MFGGASQWTCACTFTNCAEDIVCAVCEASRPVSRPPAGSVPRVGHHAFIAGLNKYSGPGFTPLHLCVADATGLSELLQANGYAVTRTLDATRAELESTFTAFAATVATGSTVVVFFAGHGLAVGASNYMVPVDGDVSGQCFACVCTLRA